MADEARETGGYAIEVDLRSFRGENHGVAEVFHRDIVDAVAIADCTDSIDYES